MTFDARERSADQGRPVELFTFARDFQRWRYTSVDRELTVDSASFAPRAIVRSGFEASNEKARSAMTLTVPRDLEVADLYRVSPPTLPVTCVVQQYHEGDGEVAMIWSGRILSVRFEGVAALMSLEPVFTSIRRVGLRRAFQRQCPHALYGSACGVNREAFRTNGTVDSIAGLVVNVPEAAAFAAGWFAGGYIEWTASGGVPERRFITDHTSAALTLAGVPFGLTAGESAKLYPGCDHTSATCSGKFSNPLNYGGFPFFTKKNPFGGDPIY